MEHRITRDPERTRAALLDAAFKEMHAHGFQAASLERILANTRLTKGALYHHFPSKHALGIAVVEEVIADNFHASMVAPLEADATPIAALQDVLASLASCPPEALMLGCPLNNLIQEMAPLDESFRNALLTVWHDWQDGIAAALARGQAAGTVKADVDVTAAARFIAAAVEGGQSVAKATHCPGAVRSCYSELARYLDSLLP